MMRSGIDPDVSLSEVFQPHNELSDLGKVGSTERLTIIILDSLPTEKYATMKYKRLEIHIYILKRQRT